ncbi:Calx-beta domain-containing protein [Limnoglobus roseus]|uniref:Beta-propeller repeat protein n=1 Tax=Limnoglobus roseus TaxID=2598579 RepID=A0A5C1AM18_9BACT|nr:Calx-beta domain-containing protein [Limnoglobus roseus]QEL19615.1 beta-propeller repeat protein [Limnoglobus roseus]
MRPTFSVWLARLWNPARRPIRPQLPVRPILGLVSLEDRSLPATLGMATLFEGPTAGSDGTLVQASGAWTASTTEPWITVTTATGTGDGLAKFSFTANAGATRTGTVTVAGQTLTVTQAGTGYVAAGESRAIVDRVFSGPKSVAADGAGNVYVTDSGLKKYTATTGVTAPVAATIQYPYAVTVDGAGNVYAVDSNADKVKKYNPTTDVVTDLFTVPAVQTPIAADAAGNVYYYDSAATAIKKYSTAGVTSTVVSDLTGNVGALQVDAAGNVYYTMVVDSGYDLNSPFKYDAATQTSTALLPIDKAPWVLPDNLMVDAGGNVYVVQDDYTAYDLLKIAPGGQVSTVVSQFGQYLDTYLSGGAIYTLDSPAQSVVRYNLADGTTRTLVAGGYDRFGNLNGLVADATGKLYYNANYGFKRYDPTGAATQITFDGTGQYASLDAAGNVYFVTYDSATDANKVQKFDPLLDQIETVYTSPAGFYIDALDVDAAGNLYYAENGSVGGVATGALRKYDATAKTATDLVSIFTLSDIAVDALGNVYYVDETTDKVREYVKATGTSVDLITGVTSSGGVEVDGSGNVFVTTSGTIKMYSPATGAVTTRASGLTSPTFLTADGAGNLYVAESSPSRISILPRAFVDTSAVNTSTAAGTVTLTDRVVGGPGLTGVLSPLSNSPWLTVDSVTSSKVNLSYTEHTGAADRTGTVTIFGKSISVTQVVPPQPTVSAATVTNVTGQGATLGGTVTATGTSSITERGVLYAPTATNANPMLNGTGVVKVADAATTVGTFTAAVAGLSSGVGYSFVAYATNANGTTYTAVSAFTTLVTVQFAAATQTVAETSPGTFTVTVNLSGAASKDVVVPFTVGGTAVSGNEYSGAAAGSVTILAGKTSATITGTIVNNGYSPADKTIVFTLGANPTNAALGATTGHTITITSAVKPSVQFAAASQTVSETVAGTFNVMLSLSAASSVDTTVPFTVGGTATPDTEYSNVSASPIVIPAGQTSVNVTGKVLNNGYSADDKTIVFTTSSPTGADLGTNTMHTLTITSAPMPTVQFLSDSQSATAVSGTFAVTVSLSAISSLPTTVNFTYGATGDTAVEGVDYSDVSASPVVIPAGQTSVTITGKLAASPSATANPTLTFTLGTVTNGTAGGTAATTLTIVEPSLVPTQVDVGGLQFREANGLQPSGSTFMSSGTVQVGFKPAAGQPFVALLTLDGTTTIDTAALTITNTGAVKAIRPSNPVTLLTGGFTAASIAALAGAGQTGLTGATFTVASLTFTPSAISLDQANADVLVQGSLALPYGLAVSVSGTNHVVVSDTGIALSGVTASIPSTGFSLGSVEFTGLSLSAAYDSTANTVTLTGTATATLENKAGNVTLALGVGQGSTPGLVFTAGALTAFDASVTTDFTVRGVTISATDLTFAYSTADAKFSLSGTAGVAIDGLGDLSVTLGHGTDPGLVVTNGDLVSLDATVNSTFTVGELTFTAGDLNFAYTAAGDMFALTGTVTSKVTGLGDLGLTFGHGTAPGLVVANGKLTSLDLTLDSNLTVGGVAFAAKGLEFTYAAATDQFALAGTVGLTVGGIGNLSVTFGNASGPGLVVADGSLTSLNLAVTGDVTIGGVTFATKGLALGYTAATSQYTLAGTAAVTVGGIGNLSVTFGHGTDPGLVITKGSLESLHTTVNSSVTIAGVTFATKGLAFDYTAASGAYALTGSAGVTITGIGNASVTFGYGTNPGLVVTKGDLTSLDMTLDTDVAIGGVTFGTKGLRFQYAGATKAFALSGSADLTVSRLGTLNVTFGYGTNPGLVVTDGALTSLDMTLNTNVRVSSVTFSTKSLRFQYAADSNRFALSGSAAAAVTGIGNLSVTFGQGPLPGLVISNGSLDSLNMTVDSNITVGSVGFATKGLNFTYDSRQATFSLAGTAAVTVGGIGNLSVTFGKGGNPGLVITDGSLTSLDTTVNSDISVSTVQFSTTGLRFTYAAANSQYTLAGSAAVTVGGIGSLSVTFGYQGSAGLVITNGSLDKLDMTVDTNISVKAVTFTTKGLRFTYAATNSQYTLTGTAGVAVTGIGSLSVTFGNGTNPGLVITNGSLDKLDMTVDSNITVKSVTFTTKGLRFTYTAANSQYTLTGTAGVAITGIGNLSVTFGYNGNPGLVITNGSLDSLDLTVNSKIRVNSVTFSTEGLRFTYTAATSQYTLSGSAGVAIVGVGDLTVTFGYNGAPGLVITNGSLDSLDMTIDSKIRVNSVIFSTKGLRFTYTAATSRYTLAGSAGVTVIGVGDLTVTFGYKGEPGLVITNGSLDKLDMTVDSNIRVNSVIFSTKALRFTYTPATSVFTLTGTAGVTVIGMGDVSVTFGYDGAPGLIITDGSLTKLDATINSQFRVNNVIISTDKLRFTYTTATSQFTLSGAAKVTVIGMGQVQVTFGDGGTPGLVITDGSLTSLDVRVDAKFTVNAIVFTADGLRFQYTAADSTFKLTGSAGVGLIGVGGLKITFGTPADPGLVITNGELKSLNMTVGADFSVGLVTLKGKGVNFRYTAATSTFTMSGGLTATITGIGDITLTFGRGTTPGLQIVDGTLTAMALTVTSDVTFAGLTFGKADFGFKYTRSSGKFVIDGTASATYGFETFAVQLGNGTTGGIVVDTTKGTVDSVNGTLSNTLGVAGLTVGNVSLALNYANSVYTLSGTGSVTIKSSLDLPSFFKTFIDLKGVSLTLGSVNLTSSYTAGKNSESYTALSVRLAGLDVGIKVYFNGSVDITGVSNAIVQGLLNAAGKVVDAAGKVVNKAASVVKSVGSAIYNASPCILDNQIAGAMVFYDANGNGVLDAGEPNTVSAADGTYRLALPEGASGLIVAFGGTNVATNLPNTMTLTAPAPATMVSPLSTLVQAVRATSPALSIDEAAATVAAALGIPDTINVLRENVIDLAMTGRADAGRSLTAAVELAGLSNGIAALVGRSGADVDAAFFNSLAAAIGNGNGDPGLANDAAVRDLILDTAGRLNVTLDDALVTGAAAVLAGINRHFEATPVGAGADYMRHIVAAQIVAGTDVNTALAAAATGQRDIASVVAEYTGAAFAAAAAATPVSTLAATVSNTAPWYALAAGDGGGARVQVFDQATGAKKADFFAFESSFRGGATVAVGDVNGDGTPDVVVAAGIGGGPRILVIDGTKLDQISDAGEISPTALLADFFAFESSFRGGASVALARLSGGLGLDIVVGAGVGGGPRVRSFSFAPQAAGGVAQMTGLIGDFFAFSPDARVGVNVAAGDLDGTGRDNVIVGAGAGGGPVVAVYNPDGTLRNQFLAYDAALRGGVSVAAGYLDGSAKAQLVTAAGPGGPGVVNVYADADDIPDRTIDAFEPSFTGGVSIGTVTTAAGTNLVVGAGPGGAPRVRVLSDDGQTIDDYFAYDASFLGGVTVG